MSVIAWLTCQPSDYTVFYTYIDSITNFGIHNKTVDTKTIVIMNQLPRLLLLVAIFCNVIPISADTAKLWVGESYTFTDTGNYPSENDSPILIYTYSGLTWVYDNDGDAGYFTLTQDPNDQQKATVKLLKFFDGTKKVKFKYEQTSWTYIQTGPVDWIIERGETITGYNTYYVECNKVGVSIYPATMSLALGESDQLTWQFSTTPPSGNEMPTVSFTSGNMNVATVTSDGIVTATGIGTTVITATSNYATSATCEVTVNATQATSITLDRTELTLAMGASQQINATVLPENATNKTVSWSSSDNNVATVDASGNVTAQATGEAVITAMTTDGSNLSATCAVTVTDGRATAIVLDKTQAELSVGHQLQLVSTVLPAGASQRVLWSSSDTSVAKVVGGVVYALDWGECLVTASTIDGSNLSANCLIKVLPSQQVKRTDVNGDGIVDITDVNLIINDVLGK